MVVMLPVINARVEKFASLEKNNWFEIDNKTEDQGRSIQKSIRTLTVLRTIFVPNLEILT